LYEAFKIYSTNIENWRKLQKETGELVPKYRKTRKRKIDFAKLEQAIEEKPDTYLSELVVLWVEDVLSESDEFKLKDLKERFKPSAENEIEVILIDVEEQPIERPKYNQKESYSGKKKNIQRNIKS